MHGYLDSSRHWVFLADPIENDVDRANEDLPHAVQAEEVAEHVEVFALERERPPLPLLHIPQRVHFQEQLPGQLFQCSDLKSQLPDVCKKKGKSIRRIILSLGMRRTLGAGGPLRDTADHAPEALFGSAGFVLLPVDRDALLLRQDHVHRERQSPLHREDVVLRDRPDEVRHARVRVVDRAEARQNGHHGHSDDADARHRLLDREHPVRHAQQRERIADPPEAVQEQDPHSQR